MNVKDTNTLLGTLYLGFSTLWVATALAWQKKLFAQSINSFHIRVWCSNSENAIYFDTYNHVVCSELFNNSLAYCTWAFISQWHYRCMPNTVSMMASIQNEFQWLTWFDQSKFILSIIIYDIHTKSVKAKISRTTTDFRTGYWMYSGSGVIWYLPGRNGCQTL